MLHACLVKVRSRVHGFYGLALPALIHVDGNADRVGHLVLAHLYKSLSSPVVYTPSSLKIRLLVQTSTFPWFLVPLFFLRCDAMESDTNGAPFASLISRKFVVPFAVDD